MSEYLVSPVTGVSLPLEPPPTNQSILRLNSLSRSCFGSVYIYMFGMFVDDARDE